MKTIHTLLDAIETTEAIARLSAAIAYQTDSEIISTPHHATPAAADPFAFDAIPDAYNPLFLSIVFADQKVN